MDDQYVQNMFAEMNRLRSSVPLDQRVMMEGIVSNITQDDMDVFSYSVDGDVMTGIGDIAHRIIADYPEIFGNRFEDIVEPRHQSDEDGRVILRGTDLYNELILIDSLKTESGHEACDICMDCPKNTIIDNCKHEFCATCLLQLRYYIKCPICKQDFESVSELENKNVS
jgi:hypothetical protein